MKFVIAVLALGIGILEAANKPLLMRPSARETSRANPFEEKEGARQAGQKLFERECSSCHGHEAQGGRRVPSLAAPALSQVSAGAIFWVLRNGSLRGGMPAFSHLPEPQRWQIVTYLKSLK